MNNLGVNENTVTGQIFISIFEILHEHLDNGISWTELNKTLEKKHPDFHPKTCLLYTSPSPRDQRGSRMPSSA